MYIVGCIYMLASPLVFVFCVQEVKMHPLQKSLQSQVKVRRTCVYLHALCTMRYGIRALIAKSMLKLHTLEVHEFENMELMLKLVHAP